MSWRFWLGETEIRNIFVDDRQVLRGCDLHLHILGAYYAEDVLALGRDQYDKVDWDKSGYLDYYKEAFGVDPAPVEAFKAAVSDPDGIEHISRLHVFSDADGGDFDRWEAKFKFFTSIWTHYRRMGAEGDLKLLQIMTDRHRAQGLDYVEYRISSGLEGLKYWHGLCAQVLRQASSDGFIARYIVSFPRDNPTEHYDLIQELFDERPELIDTIVGIDFAGKEEGEPPKRLQSFVARVLKDNEQHPERALDVVCHVGESFFDKSLESTIRWCHEVAEMGVRRLGHAIALGLDPAVAVGRRTCAHEGELVSERLDQISYDLRYEGPLSRYGVSIDPEALQAEQAVLQLRPTDHVVTRAYDDRRLEQVRGRQQFVLNRLCELGTVIESCPTSNLRIGGIPRPQDHPIHRFLKAAVNVVICSDDPGNLSVSVGSEVDLVLDATGMRESELRDRLGDPRQFRLAHHRTTIRGAA